MKKTIFIFLILIIIISIGVVFIYPRREKQISGKVLSCITNEPISGAEVTLDQRGWGISGGDLIWDKSYSSKTTTDKNGNFTISWKVGSAAKIYVDKENYMKAEQNEYPGKEVLIKILPGRSNDFNNSTYYCTPLSECLKEVNENGMLVYKNTCTHY